MNTVKKIIALITVAIIVIRVFTFNTFALAGAPVIAAEEITTLLETALIGSGLYTESELEGKDYLELNDLLKDGINSGQINPKDKCYMDPITETRYNLLDLYTKPELQVGIGVMATNPIGTAVNKAVLEYLNYMQTAGGEIYDFINPTYTVDLKGGTSAIYYYYSDSFYEVYYSSEPGELYYNGGELTFFIKFDYWEQHYKGEVTVLDQSNTLVGNFTDSHARYGQWVWREDGTEAETDDEGIPVIGEADGTQVTPDMLNPDGTVTIGDTTYSPSDYIDWDKFKDPAITDLLERILDAIESMPVVDDTQLDFDIDTDVTLPSELSDFSIPGLINVFPFCLPYDFIRGMRLFSAEAEVPHFEKEIIIPAFLNVPEQKWKFEIDFKELEPLAKITRWTSLISFVYCLILLTPKIAKGA